MGFSRELWIDIKIWVIQKYINWFLKKYNKGGRVSHGLKFARLINQLERIECVKYVQIDIVNGGMDNVHFKIRVIRK